MNKVNSKKVKQTNTLYNYFKKNNNEDKNIIQEVRNIQRKKKTHPIDIDAEERSSSLPVFVKKNNIFLFAKQVSIQQLLSKCPGLMKISQQIQAVVSLPKIYVRNILKKYMQSNSNSLWCDKYAPTDSSQLFNTKASQKIKDWFQAFFQYKNKLYESQDRYLSDFQQQKSCEIYKKIRKNQWKLQALVVRGRAGIGKSSAIKAIAEQLQIEWQQCGNHFNPTKYLKQKNESTQSQSVKTAISRKLKLQKNSQMITKFMSSEDKPQRQKTNQSLKCQIIHHVGCIFPESEASKFYSQLNRCIQLSKIPFVMTDTGKKLPYQCKDYDQIQYEVGQTKHIEEFLWILYHFERLILIDTTKFIEKQQIFDQINKQIQQIFFQQLVEIQKISHLCCINDYQLDKILNFMEYHDLQTISLEPLLIEKYSNLSKANLLQSIQYLHILDNLESDQSTTLSETNQKASNSTTDQSYSQSGKTIQIQQLKRNLFNIIHKTQISNEQDSYSSQINNLQKEIQIQIHKDIKRKLSKKLNREINVYFDRNRSTLKESQIQFFPMLVRKGSISKKTSIIQDFRTIFSQKQCLYAQKYCKFIKKP